MQNNAFFWNFVDNDNPYSQFETAAKVFLEKRDQGDVPKNKILFFEDFAKLNFAQASLRLRPDATIFERGSGDGYYEGNSDFDKNGDEVISGYEIPAWYKAQFEKTQYKYIPEFIKRCKNQNIVSIRKLPLSVKKRMFGLDDDAS